ncbi:flagellar biosynthesis repressor FlbT [Chelativorans sp. YIM 93263]|uniref:flagellar biosynthesis repressor FlbT n=1 Tax=Chelativorans sp. YIM 93263 TaxID=2906648 RepID=UPI0023796811|nr:flagellar biosynthesis repressor FlbT [Chelativorans sp. YIM 93263]
MKNTLKISLKANEKIYVNGAVIKADRKVSLEFLNDVQFLLQHHVLQPEDATTPLRQLYFIAQIMLMNPDGAERAGAMFRNSVAKMLGIFKNERLRTGLKDADELVSSGQVYEAMKEVRALYPLEDEILGVSEDHVEMPLAKAVGE